MRVKLIKRKIRKNYREKLLRIFWTENSIDIGISKLIMTDLTWRETKSTNVRNFYKNDQIEVFEVAESESDIIILKLEITDSV